MKQKHLTMICVGGAAMISPGSALGGYQGLSTTVTQVVAGGQVRNMFRVYAVFGDPDDAVTVVYGSPQVGMTIVSRNLTDTAPGSSYFNPVASHGTAPSWWVIHGGLDSNTNPIPPSPNAEFDTFFTIGMGAGQFGSGPQGSDETGNQSMPPDFINGTSFTHNNAGWFTNGPVPKGRAGWTGDGDPMLRVLIMQLTVSSTSMVRGTVNIAGVNHTGTGDQSFILSGQTFGLIPGPGALPLLAAAGLLGAPRRRRE